MSRLSSRSSPVPSLCLPSLHDHVTVVVSNRSRRSGIDRSCSGNELTGISTKVGGTLRTTVPPKNPMRMVYTALFHCGPLGDGDWEGPTMLYAVEGATRIFSDLGQGGAVVINSQGGLSWGPGQGRPPEVYVHVANEAELNAKINSLIESS